MINFAPGPAKLYESIELYLAEGLREGYFNTYHRSKKFSELYEKIITLLREKLNVPKDYEIYFISAATEAFSIVVREYGNKLGSVHLFSGSFGERWFNYAKANYQNAFGFEYSPNISVSHLSMLFYKAVEMANLLCITHVETSDGFEFPLNLLRTVNKYPMLVAVDATTSMGAYPIPWELADIWFASLQKAFGLPPGLALLIISPKALQNAPPTISYYNSIRNLHKNYLKLQTTHTPNLTNIFLLYKVLQNNIISAEDNFYKVYKNYKLWEEWLKSIGTMKHLVENPLLRAKSVLVLTMNNPKLLETLLHFTELNGVVIAKGHQKYKDNTIRIANFPQHSKQEIVKLQQLITYFLTLI